MLLFKMNNTIYDYSSLLLSWNQSAVLCGTPSVLMWYASLINFYIDPVGCLMLYIHVFFISWIPCKMFICLYVNTYYIYLNYFSLVLILNVRPVLLKSSQDELYCLHLFFLFLMLFFLICKNFEKHSYKYVSI